MKTQAKGATLHEKRVAFKVREETRSHGKEALKNSEWLPALNAWGDSTYAPENWPLLGKWKQPLTLTKAHFSLNFKN